jgi:hypothetical protein
MRLPADSVFVLPEYAELLLPDLRRVWERHRGRGLAGFEALLDELIAVAQESRAGSLAARVSASLEDEVPPLMVPPGTHDTMDLWSTREVADKATVDPTYVRRLLVRVSSKAGGSTVSGASGRSAQ